MLELSLRDGASIVGGLGVAKAFFGFEDGGLDGSESVDGVAVLIFPRLIGVTGWLS